MKRHLLVTNDFPPKLGGIQQYLWELWRRLNPETFEVHTTPYRGAAAFDSEQGFTVHRSREPVLLPYPWLSSRLNDAADRFEASLHVIDPALPLGAIGPGLDRPYAVVLHGAEVTVPARLPGTDRALARVLEGATGVISAGQYALSEAERAVGRDLESVVVPPGVDVERFQPIDDVRRAAIRTRYGIPHSAPFVLSISRLVPRKGMDTLIAAASRLQRTHPDLVVAIAGSGRDRIRLQRKIKQLGAPVRLLGRIPEVDKPGLYASADLFAMLCRSRWGGLEQEGFGIVFVEAAACGIPQIAGESGGAGEAVEDEVTGRVVPASHSIEETAAIIGELLDDDDARARMGEASRKQAVARFAYDGLAERLGATLERWA